MILKILFGAIVGAYLASVFYQYRRRIKNQRFRENLRIGHYCFVFAKVEHKEYKLKVRIKYIDRDNDKAYIDSGIKQARGWWSIHDLYVH